MTKVSNKQKMCASSYT